VTEVVEFVAEPVAARPAGPAPARS
jgi:hypothetical protein